MCAGSPPAAPDYTGAALAQGQASLQSTIANALLNRPNQSSPYGRQIWEQTGTTLIPGTAKAAVPGTPGRWETVSGSTTGLSSTGGAVGPTRRWIPGTPGTPAVAGTQDFTLPQFTGRTEFTPEGQKLFDADTAIKMGLMDAGQASLDQVKASMSTPFDLGSLPSDYNQKVADAMYGRSARMLDPQWEQAEERERNRLINAGFSMGNEGFENALGDFQRRKDSAYGDARDRSTLLGAQQGQQDRMQAISEMLLQRTQPLSELNSLRTGAQPQLPNFPSGNVGANMQEPNLLGATQAQGQAANDIYNAKVGTDNALLSTAGTLGAAGLAAYFF